jgi:hypothetical protein
MEFTLPDSDEVRVACCFWCAVTPFDGGDGVDSYAEEGRSDRVGMPAEDEDVLDAAENAGDVAVAEGASSVAGTDSGWAASMLVSLDSCSNGSTAAGFMLSRRYSLV